MIKKKTQGKFNLILFFLLAIFIKNSQATEYHCPLSIRGIPQKLGTWEVVARENERLFNVNKPEMVFLLDDASIYNNSSDGNMAELIPDNDDDLGGDSKENALWTFLPEDSSQHWIACNYYHTDLVARQLSPANVKSCKEIKEVSSKGKLQGIKVVCKV